MKIDLTLYDLLEVSPQASARVIRAAYRCLTQANHPDKNPDTVAACDRQAQLNHAYSVLSDPDKRQRYDRVTGLPTRTVERRGNHPGGRVRARSTDADAPAPRAFVFRPLT